MNRYTHHLPALSLGALFLVSIAAAQNPLVMDQFTADPTARVFEGKIYVYPSHDIPASPGRGRANWFVMEDYHVFSSENLVDWTDHGVILEQTKVPWRDRPSYDMWAPDCVFKNGKYYFYYPTGGRIGVAIADKPYGPFTPEAQPIQGVRGIDPGVLIDDDGSAYLFWGGISMAKLKDNMVELDSQPQRVQNLPRPGLIEGPFPFKRNGIYYLTYPHVQKETERLEYSIAESPLGPYEWKGVIMDETPSGCWTNHQSIVEYKGQWYLFYHDKDLSPEFDKNRAIKADYLFFNEDGTIRKVIPTHRGVGIVNAQSKVQIDRYSAISEEGVSVSFLNDANKNEGWKIALAANDAWVRFNKVDFGAGDLKSVNVRAVSPTGGTVEIRLDKADGPVLAKVEIKKGDDWSIVNSKLASAPSGVHDLIVTLKGDESNVEIDWVSFE
ncbi:MAG: family 43 glycosylhydrolase [Sedimentisphaerales bacterium]|nr:family 43 glycosylhydrolase [Sedimentisphaerales bacterium]